LSANLHRLLRDAKLFDAKLGQIDGAGNTGAYLIQLAEAKTVVDQGQQEKVKSEDKSQDASTKKEDEKPAPAVP
jgi:vacuolar protein sorting-associated protein 54